MAGSAGVPTQQVSLRQLQIIVIALITGLLLALVAFSVLAQNQNHPIAEDLAPIFSYASVAAVVVAVGLQAFVAQQLDQRAAAQWSEDNDDDDAVMSDYVIRSIVRAAIVEGGGMFSAISYFLVQEWLCLVAGGLAVAALFWMIPSRSSYETWKQTLVRHARDTQFQ